MSKTQGMTRDQVRERMHTLEKLTASNAAEIVMLWMKAHRIQAEIDADEDELRGLRRQAAMMMKASLNGDANAQDGDSQGGKA